MFSFQKLVVTMSPGRLRCPGLTGSHAETVYQHLGWHKVGDVPDYAAEPDGTLHATAIHYKRLR